MKATTGKKKNNQPSDLLSTTALWIALAKMVSGHGRLSLDQISSGDSCRPEYNEVTLFFLLLLLSSKI